MLNILIAGDCIFEPEPLRELLLHDIEASMMIRVKRYEFGETQYLLNESTRIPTGMAMENPSAISRYPDYGVREFYGDPLALYDEIGNAHILIIHGAALPRVVIEHALNLRAVITLRGGAVNVDVDCLKERGIQFFNTPGKNAQSVAEFVLGQLLDFERGYTYGNIRLRNNQWWIKAISDYKSHELQGKSFGLIGYGRIARCFRKLLRSFDARVYAYSPHVAEQELLNDDVYPTCLDDLVKCSHYVSLHTRPEKGVPPLMDARVISLMRSDAVLINSARGGLLDYGALKQALSKNKIRGAVIDVLGDEPFGFYKELIDMPNALVTPHIAGITAETIERGYKMAVQAVSQSLQNINI